MPHRSIINKYFRKVIWAGGHKKGWFLDFDHFLVVKYMDHSLNNNKLYWRRRDRSRSLSWSWSSPSQQSTTCWLELCRCGDSLADGWMAWRPEITCPHRCLRLANYLKLPRIWYSLGTHLVLPWYSRVSLVVLALYSLGICLFLSWTKTPESWCPLFFLVLTWYYSSTVRIPLRHICSLHFGRSPVTVSGLTCHISLHVQ